MEDLADLLVDRVQRVERGHRSWKIMEIALPRTLRKRDITGIQQVTQACPAR